VKVASTTNSTFEKGYYPEAYAGNHTIRIVAEFVNIWLEIEEEEDIEYFNVITCVNQTNNVDFRIDKLHDYETNKGFLDGSGVTICIIDDQLGCHSDLDEFHKSLYFSGKNDIYDNPDRKYIDIEYYQPVLFSEDKNFTEYWDNTTTTRLDKWEEIFEENEGTYDEVKDVHGTYMLASCRQIAPGADYIFIECNDSSLYRKDALRWLTNDTDDPNFGGDAPFIHLGIDIIIMSWSNDYYFEDLEDEFSTLASNGVIPVCAAGQAIEGTSGSIFRYDHQAYFPCSFDDVIGVTGVDDRYFSSNSWDKHYSANSGWGVDTAGIYNGTILDWAPYPGNYTFMGTSNASPMVGGVLALVEQFQNSHNSSVDLTVELVQEILKYTGDAPGIAPSASTEVEGYLEGIHDSSNSTYYQYFPYHDNADYPTYDLGWGIIDGYEMYKYYADNY